VPIELDPENPRPPPDDPDVEILADLLEAIWTETRREISRMDVATTMRVVRAEAKTHPN
jgi:hypothetical protein